VFITIGAGLTKLRLAESSGGRQRANKKPG
jgi:hypothetical protein